MNNTISFQRTRNASQRDLSASHMIVTPWGLFSVIATVSYTRAKLERNMGSWTLNPLQPRLYLAVGRMHLHQVRSQLSSQSNLAHHPEIRIIINTNIQKVAPKTKVNIQRYLTPQPHHFFLTFRKEPRKSYQNNYASSRKIRKSRS